MPRAASLAVELIEALKGPIGASQKVEEVTLVPSGGGVFDVDVDGRVVFSKKSIGRHAEPGEVLRIVLATESKS